MDSNKKRIFKNTMYLYIRMFIMMVISLYAVRIILQTLGTSDYGIYNVVGGFVTIFFFIGNSLSYAIQRFVAFDLGRKDNIHRQQIFTLSVHLFLILSVVIIIIAETVGVWFVNEKLNYSPERHEAALLVFQYSIVTAIFNFFRIPFNASIIAHERMSFYAWVSIIESILKLVIVFLLIISPFDKLRVMLSC